MAVKHNNPLVEQIAQTIWNAEPHRLLEHAGRPTEWEAQPSIVRRDKWRLAIRMLATFSEHATINDLPDRLKCTQTKVN